MINYDQFNVNWDTIKRGEKRYDTAMELGQRENINKRQAQKEQENAIKKAIIEAIVTGKTQAPAGMDYAELGVPRGMDLGKFKPIKSRTGTSVSITQRPYSEILKAQEISARTPQEYAKAGMATLGERKRGTGVLGTGWGPGSQREPTVLSPGATAEQATAKKILMNPYKVTKRFSGGLPDENTTITDTEGNSYDASEYEEGTQAEIDGVQYKVEQGQWVQI